MTTVDSSAVEALGWALVHFAWQGALAGAVFAVLDFGLRGSSPRLRYALAAATLAAMALMPPLTFLATRTGAHDVSSETPVIVGRPAGTTPVMTHAAPAAYDRSGEPVRQRIADALPAIVGLWCAGVLVFSVRYLGGWRLVQRMDRSARPVTGGEIADRLGTLARRMRITRPVRLLESAIVEVPTVVGWLRPAILLPVATMAGLSAEQLEALLAHELAHIRRQDYLAGLLQSAVETVLFYQPAVWWVSHRMRVERELCCDDEAVAACGNPIRYARALADLEAARPAPLLAQAATGGPLFERIARLVAPSGHAVRASRGAAALLALAAIALAATGATSLRASAVAGQGAAESTEAKRSTPATAAKAAQQAAPSARPRAAATAAPAEAADKTKTRPVPIERVIELASAGVTPAYIDALAALGYPSLSWDQLIAMRSQGVSASFMRGMADAGHPRLTPDQLIALRSQGVSPEFVRELAAEGLKELSMSDLVELRSQGVSPEYVRDLRAAGHGGLSVTDLLGARSHGVSTEDATALKSMGYTDLSLGRLVSLRSQGVSAEYVRELQAEGYKGLSVPVLIGLRSQGVTVEYVRELKQLGYGGLQPGELIELRSHGVTPEFVREIKDAGYDRLTTRELIELRSRGVEPALLKRLKARGEGTR